MGRMSAACDSLERLSLGAYVLGALDPVERSEVEAHVSACPLCRDELAELSGLPGLLSRVTLPETLERPQPAPPAMAERLIERVRAARRSRRRRLAGAAGALTAAAVAALALVLAGGDAGTPGGTVPTISATNPRTGVAANLALRPAAWGTEVRVRLRGVPAGTRCRLVAVSRDGRHEVAGTWRADYEGRANVETATAIPRSDLARLDVVTEGGRRLVRAQL
jgi:anti-sigma factor RsiW